MPFILSLPVFLSTVPGRAALAKDDRIIWKKFFQKFFENGLDQPPEKGIFCIIKFSSFIIVHKKGPKSSKFRYF